MRWKSAAFQASAVVGRPSAAIVLAPRPHGWRTADVIGPSDAWAGLPLRCDSGANMDAAVVRSLGRGALGARRNCRRTGRARLRGGLRQAELARAGPLRAEPPRRARLSARRSPAGSPRWAPRSPPRPLRALTRPLDRSPAVRLGAARARRDGGLRRPDRGGVDGAPAAAELPAVAGPRVRLSGSGAGSGLRAGGSGSGGAGGGSRRHRRGRRGPGSRRRVAPRRPRRRPTLVDGDRRASAPRSRASSPDPSARWPRRRSSHSAPRSTASCRSAVSAPPGRFQSAGPSFRDAGHRRAGRRRGLHDPARGLRRRRGDRCGHARDRANSGSRPRAASPQAPCPRATGRGLTSTPQRSGVGPAQTGITARNLGSLRHEGSSSTEPSTPRRSSSTRSGCAAALAT